MPEPLLKSVASATVGALMKGLAARAKTLVLGPEEERALRGVFERALTASLEVAAGRLDRQTAHVIESVLERWFFDSEVQAELVESVIGLRLPSAERLRERFGALDLADAKLPIEFDNFIPTFATNLERELEAETGLNDSVLSNMVVQGRLKLILEAIMELDAVSSGGSRGTVPRRPDLLIGRDGDLEELLRRLAPKEDSTGEVAGRLGPPMTAVVGLPGVGKTSVAAELCARDEAQYFFPDGLLWASLGPSPDLVSILAEWSRSVGGPELEGYFSAEEASRRLAAFLRGKRMLVVADDVFEAEHAMPLKVIAEGALLATTRAPEVARGLAAHRDIYELRVLDNNDSAELLRELAPSLAEDEPDQLRTLARQLDGLPLALQVAGKLLEEESAYGWGVEDLLGELCEGKRLLQSKAPADVGGLAGDVAPTVAALLRTSYERLGEDAREGFRRLGVMAAKPATFDLRAAEAVWDSADGRIVMRTLARRGLIEQADGDRFMVHPVLSAFATSMLEKDQKELRDVGERHARHFAAVLGRARALYFGGDERTKEGARLLGVNWENIRGGHAWAQDRRDQEEAAARLCLEYMGAGENWLPLRLIPAEHVEWAQAAVEAARYLGDRAAEAGNLLRLGNGQERSGRPDEAKDCYEAALERYEEIGHRLGVGRALGSLGVCYKALGDPVAAERCYRGQLDIIRVLDDPHNEAATRGNLGVLYKDAGKPADAIREISRAREVFRRVGNIREAAGASANLGMVYLNSGDLDRAEAELRQYLEMARSLDDRESESMALGNLGFVHSDRGDHETAIGCHKESLDIARELGNARAECSAIGNLASAHHLAGNSRQAINLYEEQIQIASSTGDLRCAADAHHNLGNLIAATRGDPVLALTLLQIGWQAYREVGYPLGEANALLNASRVHANAYGDLEQARSFAAQALEIYERIGSPTAQEARRQLRRYQAGERS